MHKTAILKEGESAAHGTWKMKKMQTWKNADIKGIEKQESASNEATLSP